ncbi:MAG: hypothetical protein WCC99_10425 [Candidatus Sulfotelmatobacter sp.]
MTCSRLCYVIRTSLLALFLISLQPITLAQGAKKPLPETPIRDADADHEEKRSEWFLHGRVVPGESSAELRRRAYQSKMQARAVRTTRGRGTQAASLTELSSGGWTPLGPVPLASDATGTGFQDYHQVSGRATAIAIDPADGSGSTVYIGGAQGGVWKSTNAATSIANNVTWTPLTDDQATLSIGSIAIEPGNSNPAESVVLVGTGEADNSADSYFGLGFLRSTNGGTTWAPLISTANSGTLSFSGLGATRMAFSTASGQTNTVVAAMAATGEGITAGALTSNTYRGLYTSTDAGQTWTYDAIFSGGASEATSATSVVYNAAAGLFFAALRYHGFYSSPDGVTWTALANQPGAPGLLSATACPQSYVTTCPIYRGEITVVPGRNEMYVWFVSADSSGDPVDQGIWQSTTSGASWTQISDNAIINCGDSNGCGVEQGFYNLELAAVPNCPSNAPSCATNTDLYAGAINLYKCSINSGNPTCANPTFMNLTHVYGCDPLSALAHVHPDQHVLAYTIPRSGSDLMYFANDGGIYRALNGFAGLMTGSCSGTNQFDDLNQNLGSMTQFVSFSQHASNPNTMLGGTQDNGSPATATATTSTGWGNVLSGDGGYNAIDSNTGDWFASNPDTGSGSLAIQECPSGMNCIDSLFNVVVSSGDVGGDDGSFYFPYILDPQSTGSMLVGTCRVWSGPRSGGAFTLLSLNFDTLGFGTCAGTEVNVVRALAAGGPENSNGSEVIYATTDGLGPDDLSTPIGGNVWVTTNALAVAGTVSTFSNVTTNDPSGSINPKQFPISGVAIDTSDATGNTAYVTVMGFTGGPGHVWQTTNAGTTWSDFSGTGANAIPDSPANAVVIDPVAHMVYVGTDVGVFQSSTSASAWTEVGPIPSATSSGFLPNVAVTALGLFNSGGQKLLRASTYGRGLWQFNLLAKPDFQIAVSNTPLTVFVSENAVFNGMLSAVNGYNSTVELSCIAGSSSPPNPCVPSPATLTPTQDGAAFSVSAGAAGVADYYFNAQGVGFDPNSTTHVAAITLHVVNWSMTAPSPSSVNEPRGATSPPVSFQIAAQGTFSQSVGLSCSFTPSIPGATCNFTPGASFNLSTGSPVNATATVTVPVGITTGSYGVTIQATTAGAILTTSFIANVVPNPTFVLSLTNASFSNVKAGSTGTTGSITIASQDAFTGTVNLSCVSAFGSGSCSVKPASVSVAPPPAGPATATLTINGTSFSAGSYEIAVQGTSGSITNSLKVPFNVGDYVIAGPATVIGVPGGSATANLTFTSLDSYSGTVNATCDSTALPGAQCTLSPVSPIVIGSGAVVAVIATITVPNGSAPGTCNIKINTQDAAGEPSHIWTTSLSVQDFTFSTVTPASNTAGSGQTVSYNLSVMPVGASFADAVTLSCSGAPASSTCSVSPNTVTPGNNSAAVVVTVATTGSTAQDNYSLAVTGTSGSLSHSVTFLLTIANSFTLAVTQPFPSAGVDAGAQNVAAKISVTPDYSGSVIAACNATTLSGTQCALTPASPIAISGSPVTVGALINIPSNAVPGTYNIGINVQDSSGTPNHSVTIPFTVIQDYNIANLSAISQTISAGQSITYNLSVSPVGGSYSNPVTLSCKVSPSLAGSACSFSPSPAELQSGPAAVVMTVTTQTASGQVWLPRAKAGPWLYAMWLVLAAVVVWGTAGRRRWSQALLLAFVFCLIIYLPSCGGAGQNGGSSNPGGNTTQGIPVTYTITVLGSPASISQPNGASVTLIVQ